MVIQLLDKNPKNRLGTKGGYEEVLQHPFFGTYRDTDMTPDQWKEALGRQELEAPITFNEFNVGDKVRHKSDQSDKDCRWGHVQKVENDYIKVKFFLHTSQTLSLPKMSLVKEGETFVDDCKATREAAKSFAKAFATSTTLRTDDDEFPGFQVGVS